jgi:hypothetical protein
MGTALLEAVVGGNAGISLALALLVGAPLWSRRRTLAGVWRDPAPRRRAVSRLALALQGAFLLWVTFFDYWRQLLGLPMRAEARRFTDPYTLAPVLADHGVPDAARATTLVLLVVAALALALLCYRREVGVFVPICALLAGLLAHVLLSQVRWQFDIWAKNGFPQVGQRGPGPLLGDVAFFAAAVALAALVCLAYYLALAGLLAVPLTLIGDLIARRTARPTAEYREFAALLSARAAASRSAQAGRAEPPPREAADAPATPNAECGARNAE